MAHRTFIFLLVLFHSVASGAAGPPASGPPIHIGLDAEFGNRTSTADDAIKAGIEIAIDEINARGGVLAGKPVDKLVGKPGGGPTGRPLVLVTRDNRGIPARGVDNLRELAGVKDLVAVIGSKFSPVMLGQVGPAHELKLPLLDPWAAADGIIDHGRQPSYTFRLSLRDGWVMPFLMQSALKRGYRKIGLLLPNGAWGRSNRDAAEHHASRHDQPALVKIAGFDWSDTSLANEDLELVQAGAEAILVVGNEPEIALLLKDMTALPKDQWRPLFSHWGAAAGDLPGLAGQALGLADLSVVQTFSFLDNPDPKAKAVLKAAMAKLALDDPGKLRSPVGVAHGYDLVHLLARAIDLAGSTDREHIRAALERLPRHVGLIRTYQPAFSRDRHEALGPEQLFLARWRPDGSLTRVGR